MAGINGTIGWGFQPLEYNSKMSYDYRFNYLVSANSPLRFQLQWSISNNVNKFFNA